jgi:hypothetical protein
MTINEQRLNAHQRYLNIFKIIEQRDRQMASTFNDPRRSNAPTMLARMRSEGLLMADEFSSLSQETPKSHVNQAKR